MCASRSTYGNLTESLPLAAAGACWDCFGRLGRGLLLLSNRELCPGLTKLIDPSALVFTSVVSLLSGVLFGLAPALAISRTNLSDSLKEGGRGGTASRGQRMRGMLVVAQMALALMLLVGAGLMVRSFARLQQVNPGFEPEGLLTLQLSLPETRYGKRKQASFYRSTRASAALPGSAGAPVSRLVRHTLLRPECLNRGAAIPLKYRWGGLFSAPSLSRDGHPPVAGRPLTEEDNATQRPSY